MRKLAAGTAVIAALGLAGCAFSGAEIEEAEVEYLEEHRGLTRAEAEREADGTMEIVELARHAMSKP